MRCYRVLLISSDDVGWIGLRTILAQRADVRVVGTVRHAADAVRFAEAEEADAVLLPPTVDGLSAVPLVRHLGACWPACKILVIGDVPPAHEYAALWRAGIAAYLQGPGLSPRVVQHALAGVLDAQLQVISQAIAEQMRRPLERRRQVRLSGLVLTAQERAVLKGLAAGLTQAQIAAQEYLSPRTVRRTVAALEAKFEAPSAFVLGMKAAQQGFLFDAPPRAGDAGRSQP